MPRVVGETKRGIPERPPPTIHSLSPHKWFSDESRSLFDAAMVDGGRFDSYLSDEAERRIMGQALRGAEEQLEVLGFLLGEVNRWDGRTYTLIRSTGTTTLKSTPSNVRFDHAALPQLFLELDCSGFDYIIVGWYHSHPGHTCFLSRTDLETQRTMFDQAYHSALVVDPINEEIKMFKLFGSGYEEISFAVTSAVMPPSPVRRRVRRLKDSSKL